MRSFVFRLGMRLLGLPLLVACASAPAPGPVAPRAYDSTAKSSQPPATATAAPAAPPAQVPPPPASCRAFAFTEKATRCAEDTKVSERLSLALERADSLDRDRELACIESAFPDLSGLVRALRADLAPLACADSIVTQFLETNTGRLDLNDEHALRGLLVAARLSRLSAPPPELAPPFDKPRFLEFFEHELKPWMLSQALAIGALSQQAAKLSGYGKAVGALEAGLADLNFVQAVRAVPLPSELLADPELKNAYYASLDEALEPRKARGRDAALVALRLMAELGVTNDPRLSRARSLLSELYAGSRVDALDRLLLPELPPLVQATPEQKLAARLPTYYAARLLGAGSGPVEPALLRAFLERGVPPAVRARLESGKLAEPSRILYAWFELRRGVLYFSGPAFKRVVELLGPKPESDAASLAFAIGRALQAAPKDIAELMLSSPRLAGPLGENTLLDALAKGKGPYRAEAEFDSAYLGFLTPPQNDAKFWQELERRFRRASQALKRPEARAFSLELAESAAETARAVLRSPSASGPSTRP